MIPASYRGREQTYSKHALLRAYLERLFMTIGQREQRICYVDCFSGPWQEGGENLEDTSVAISLDVMEKCHHALNDARKYVQFRGLYIESNKKSFSKLKDFLDSGSRDGTSARCLNGDFRDLREDILGWCGKNDFCFFFIDPTGWKDVSVPNLKPLLMRPKSEFLINFMYDFFLRAHAQESFEEHMKEMLGEAANTTGMTPEQREEHLLGLYCRRLKSVHGPGVGNPRCAVAKIPYPTKDRTFYDLVYLTRHPMGLIVFMETAESLLPLQRQIQAVARQEKRIGRTGQTEMFSAAKLAKEESRGPVEKVKEYWLKKLSRTPVQFGVNEFADMLEETGWLLGDFQKAFFELEAEGRVKNLASTGNRSKHAVHFRTNGNKGEFLLKV